VRLRRGAAGESLVALKQFALDLRRGLLEKCRASVDHDIHGKLEPLAIPSEDIAQHPLDPIPDDRTADLARHRQPETAAVERVRKTEDREDAATRAAPLGVDSLELPPRS